MSATLQVHSRFVTALNRFWPQVLLQVKNRRCCLLQCDKASWFCHTEAPTVGFVVQALIVSGDNGLGAAAVIDEINVRRP
jgi:hypothetical protein